MSDRWPVSVLGFGARLDRYIRHENRQNWGWESESDP